MELENKNKSQHLTIIDLTESKGVGYFLKDALFSQIKDQTDNLIVENIVPKSIIRSDFRLLTILIFINAFSFIKDILRSVRVSLKLFFSSNACREDILYQCLNVEYDGIRVGDCILSAYFRNVKLPTIPKKSLSLLAFYFIAMINVGFQLRQISVRLKKYKSSRLLFYNLETTGWHEIWRRYLITKNIGELRYSNFHSSFKVFYGFSGEELRKSSHFRNSIYENLTQEQINRGKIEIEKLINREKTYAYLKSFDIDCSKRISMPKMNPKKTVIIFLSTISDAQYSYGIGPYPDLISFQERILEASLQHNYNVVVKPHPNMFKEKDYTAKDQRYFEYLKKKWNVKNDTNNLQISDINPNLYFAHPAISAIELSRVFPDFMCVTQHGTVAAECALLDIFTVVGKNSRYFDGDKFVRIMHSNDEVYSIFNEWQQFSGFKDHQRETIFKFSYLNNISCRPPYANVIFKNCMPDNVDSWRAETWLEGFIKIKENRDLATKSSRLFVKTSGVELDKCFLKPSNSNQNVLEICSTKIDSKYY